MLEAKRMEIVFASFLLCPLSLRYLCGSQVPSLILTILDWFIPWL